MDARPRLLVPNSTVGLGTVTALSPGERGIAVGSADGMVRILETGFERLVSDFEEPGSVNHRVAQLCFLDGERLLAVAAGSSLKIFDVLTRHLVREHRGSAVYGFLMPSSVGVQALPDDGYVGTFSDASIACWGPGGELRWSQRGDWVPRLIRVTPSNTILGGDGFELCLRNASTGELIWKATLSERIFALDLIAAAEQFVVRTPDCILTGDLGSGEILKSIEAPRGAPILVANPLDGALFYGIEGGVEVLDRFGVKRVVPVSDTATTLAFDVLREELLMGTRGGQVLVGNPPIAAPAAPEPTTLSVYNPVDFSRAPNVRPMKEPLWPVSTAYCGFGCGFLGAVCGVLALPTAELPIMAANIGQGLVIGLLLGGVIGLLYGLWWGDRSL